MAITVNQIAEQCGVSRTTVLRALNGGSVSKDTKERILQVAKDNNYRRNNCPAKSRNSPCQPVPDHPPHTYFRSYG